MSPTQFVKIDDQHASLSGQVHFSNVIQLLEDGRNLMVEMTAVSLDCSALEKSGSPGIALLLAYARFCRRQKKSISFVNLPAQLRAIAGVYGIDKFLALNHG